MRLIVITLLTGSLIGSNACGGKSGGSGTALGTGDVMFADVSPASLGTGTPDPETVPGAFDPAGLYARESHERMNETNMAAGAPGIAGTVFDGAAPYPGMFEVQLVRQAPGTEIAADSLRVLFADLRSSFQVWPQPGVHELTVHLEDGRTSAPVTVHLVDGESVSVDVVME